MEQESFTYRTTFTCTIDFSEMRGCVYVGTGEPGLIERIWRRIKAIFRIRP